MCVFFLYLKNAIFLVGRISRDEIYGISECVLIDTIAGKLKSMILSIILKITVGQKKWDHILLKLSEQIITACLTAIAALIRVSTCAWYYYAYKLSDGPKDVYDERIILRVLLIKLLSIHYIRLNNGLRKSAAAVQYLYLCILLP